MPKNNQCTVCCNQYRKKVDVALAGGTSVRKVAVQFALSVTAVQRHKLKHLISNAKAIAVQQAVHAVRQAENAEKAHEERVESVWATRLESAYADAQWGIERSKQDGEKDWHAGARYLTAKVKACEVGLRAVGGISDGRGGTTINVGQMLVMPTAPRDAVQRSRIEDAVIEVVAQPGEER